MVAASAWVIDVVPAAAALGALAIVVRAALHGWRDWTAFKRDELAAMKQAASAPMSERIEIADFRERLRKLEAIAAGVDLA